MVEDSAHIEDVISDLEAQRDAMVEDMNNRIVRAKVRRECATLDLRFGSSGLKLQWMITPAQRRLFMTHGGRSFPFDAVSCSTSR